MRSLASEAPPPFEFHATLTQLDDGLDTIHRSVALLRERAGRPDDDHNLMLFELALAEIGSNSLVHGTAPGSDTPRVEYALRLDGVTAIASLTDQGPPVHNLHTRAMPAPTSEAGRGLAIARQVLDQLAYERDGEMNTWRLVKRL
jgi:anti-sigma regulatory factor (Ser/Thr protein kinase)